MNTNKPDEFESKSIEAVESDEELMTSLALGENEPLLISSKGKQNMPKSVADIINDIAPPELLISLHNNIETDPAKIAEEDKLVEIYTDGKVILYNAAKREEGINEAAQLFWRALEFHGKSLTELIRDRAMAVTAQSIYLKAFIQGSKELLELDLPEEIRANLENTVKAASPFAEQEHLNQIQACMLVRTPVSIKPTIPGWYVLFSTQPGLGDLYSVAKLNKKDLDNLSLSKSVTHWSLIDVLRSKPTDS